MNDSGDKSERTEVWVLTRPDGWVITVETVGQPLTMLRFDRDGEELRAVFHAQKRLFVDGCPVHMTEEDRERIARLIETKIGWGGKAADENVAHRDLMKLTSPAMGDHEFAAKTALDDMATRLRNLPEVRAMTAREQLVKREEAERIFHWLIKRAENMKQRAPQYVREDANRYAASVLELAAADMMNGLEP